MCIIAVYRTGTNMPEEEIKTMWNGNRDGVGYAIYDEKTGLWKVKKGIMELSQLLKEMESLGFLNNKVTSNIVIHFRAATHGGIVEELTHPFRIFASDGEIILFHNGVFSLSGVGGYSLKGIYDSVFYDYEYCGIYSYEKELEKLVESNEESATEEEITDNPYKLLVHSDTSYFCKLISDLSLNTDSIIKLLQSSLLNSVINFSRLCLCLPNNPEPILIGSWIKDEGRDFSNSSYKFKRYIISARKPELNFSKPNFFLYEKDNFVFEEDDDKETEENFFEENKKVKVGKISFILLEDKKIAVPYFYDPESLAEDGGYIVRENKKRLKLVLSNRKVKDSKIYEIRCVDENKNKPYAISDNGILYNIDSQNKLSNIMVKEKVIYPYITHYVDTSKIGKNSGKNTSENHLDVYRVKPNKASKKEIKKCSNLENNLDSNVLNL